MAVGLPEGVAERNQRRSRYRCAVGRAGRMACPTVAARRAGALGARESARPGEPPRRQWARAYVRALRRRGLPCGRVCVENCAGMSVFSGILGVGEWKFHVGTTVPTICARRRQKISA